jgi:hypothetical protein
MWYSVGKQLIKTDELKNKLIQSGLEEVWMPNAIRPADAFRRATKEIESRKATANAGVFENYLIQEVFADKDYVQRNIVVESVNQAGKRLDYNSRARVITLDKKNESITSVSEKETAKELCMEAGQRFNIFKDNYSAQQLRVMVNKKSVLAVGCLYNPNSIGINRSISLPSVYPLLSTASFFHLLIGCNFLGQCNLVF